MGKKESLIRAEKHSGGIKRKLVWKESQILQMCKKTFILLTVWRVICVLQASRSGSNWRQQAMCLVSHNLWYRARVMDYIRSSRICVNAKLLPQATNSDWRAADLPDSWMTDQIEACTPKKFTARPLCNTFASIHCKLTWEMHCFFMLIYKFFCSVDSLTDRP